MVTLECSFKKNNPEAILGRKDKERKKDPEAVLGWKKKKKKDKMFWAPRGAKVNFPRVNNTQIKCVPISSNFLRRYRENECMAKKLLAKKYVFWPFGLFWPLFGR